MKNQENKRKSEKIYGFMQKSNIIVKKSYLTVT